MLNKELFVINNHTKTTDNSKLFLFQTEESETIYNDWYSNLKKSFTLKVRKLIKNFYKLNIFNTQKNNLQLNLIYLKYVNYYNNRFNFLTNNKFINVKSYFLIILNIKKKKPFINVIIKDKTLIAVSSGFILKKLNINEKKSKKNLKTLYLILKIMINNLNKRLNKYNKIIFQIKGSKKKLLQIIMFLKKKIKFSEIIFIYTPNFYQNSIKFKKIKSIKKRLRKKFLNK